MFIKVRLEFPFKNVSVSYHPKVIRQTVPFCRSEEREGTFSEFCTQFGFRVAAAVVLVLVKLNADQIDDSFLLTSSPVQRDTPGIARRESGASAGTVLIYAELHRQMQFKLKCRIWSIPLKSWQPVVYRAWYQGVLL